MSRRSLPWLFLAAAAAGLSLQAALGAEPWAWGLAGLRGASPVLVLAATGLFLVAFVFPPPEVFLRRVGALTGGPGPWLAGLGAAALFYALRSHDLVGDWSLVLTRLQRGEYYPSNLGANAAARLVRLVAAPLGADGDDVLALTSALAGGAAVAALGCLARALAPEDPRRRAFLWLFPLLAGATQVFQGHLEVYGPLAAAVVAFLAAHAAAHRRRLPPARAGFLLGVAGVAHGSAFLLLPPFLLATARSARRRPAGAATLAFCAWLLPVAGAFLLLFFCHWHGTPPADPVRRWGTFLGARGEGLCVAPGALLDARHLWDRLNVLFRVAAAAVFVLPAGRLRGGGTPFLLALSLAALLPWVFCHRLSYPPPLDWDLFALVGLVMGVWAGAVLPLPPGRAVRLLLLAAYTALPWWGRAAFPPLEGERAYHLALAAAYARAGGPGAEAAYLRHLRRAASLGDPPDRTALRALSVYLAERRHPEAPYWLERAARAYPDDPEMRANLGQWYRLRGMYGRARRELEAAVRLAPDHAPFRVDLAAVLEKLQDEEEAYRHYRRAVALAPTRRECVEAAVRLALRLNRPRAALALLEDLYRRIPPDRPLLEALFRTALRAGALAKAKRYQAELARLPRGRR